MVKIDLTDLLKEVGNEQDFSEDLALTFPEDGLDIKGPVKCDLHIINADERVIVNGTIEANVRFDCARCLKEFFAPVKAEIEEYFSKEPQEPDDEDIVFPISEKNTIDLTEAIRQDLLIELPLKAVCSKICKLPGAPEEIKRLDPRLAKLKELMKKEK